MTCTFFFSTYAVPKAVVRCYIKNSPQKWPADILWKIHEIMLRNEIVRFFSLMKCRKRQFVAVLKTPWEMTCRHFVKNSWNYASKWSCTFFWSLMRYRKRQFIAALRNSPRSDLPTFYENPMKLCFEMKLYVLLITYEVSKAPVRCCIKKLSQKWPADVLWKTHQIMLRNNIVRFLHHLWNAESDSPLLH